jgi:hypothetical protein
MYAQNKKRGGKEHLSAIDACPSLNDIMGIRPVISWRSVLLMEETGIPRENH